MEAAVILLDAAGRRSSQFPYNLLVGMDEDYTAPAAALPSVYRRQTEA